MGLIFFFAINLRFSEHFDLSPFLEAGVLGGWVNALANFSFNEGWGLGGKNPPWENLGEKQLVKNRITFCTQYKMYKKQIYLPYHSYMVCVSRR